MYCYITQEPKGDSEHEQLQQIFSKIKSSGIEGKQIAVASADQLRDAKFAELITEDCKSLVAIGNDTLFEFLLSLSENLPKETAYGFIPTNPNTSNLAHAMGIKDWRDAVTTVRSRRIEPTQLIRLNESVVLFEKLIAIDTDNNKTPAICRFEKHLELRAPITTIQIRNFTRDEQQKSAPIGIKAYRTEERTSKSGTDFFSQQIKSINNEGGNQDLVFRLTCASCEFKLPGQAKDHNGQSFSTNLTAKPWATTLA